MKKLLVSAALALFSASSLNAQNIPQYEGYDLVWNDEFNQDGALNPKDWTHEEGFKRNEELQWYQSENAFCEDGKLIIDGRKETRPNPTYVAGSSSWRESRKNIDYTSACVTTQDRKSWLYGRFEVRAKITAEEGLWPAIWFLGIEGEWPSNGEIDLMEYYHGSILANACWGTKNRWAAKWDESKRPVSEFGGPNWDDEFHYWRMDWDKHSIKLYLDGKLLNEIDVDNTNNATTTWGPKNPFRQPQYLLLNLALGGNRGGDVSKTTFPSRYEIDYVRVYQKNALGIAKEKQAIEKQQKLALASLKALPKVKSAKSYELVGKAWGAQAKGDHASAIAYCNKCIEMYMKRAKKVQSQLSSLPKGSRKEINSKYAILNDVGISLFIKATSLEKVGDLVGAKKAYTVLYNDVKYAQCWDNKGWFWCPSDVAKKKLNSI